MHISYWEEAGFILMIERPFLTKPFLICIVDSCGNGVLQLLKRRRQMGRPVTLFTGQWADLLLETLAKNTSFFHSAISTTFAKNQSSKVYRLLQGYV
jgi:hypothetical protein